MGCVSSKLFKKNLKQDILFGNGEDFPNHVVSLTSSTYGVLQLDKQNQDPQIIKENVVIEVKKKSSPNRQEQPPEVINAWELMEGLEEEAPVVKKSPKSRVFLNLDARSPLKFLNQMGSPRKSKKFGGKENKVCTNGSGRFDYSPKTVLKACNLADSCRKSSPKIRFLRKQSPNPNDVKCDSFRVDSVTISTRRKSLGPLFDPEELSRDQEQIKKMISSEIPKSTKETEKTESSTTNILEKFEEKCPPGGENAVVIYTTTLRGIRKTFEDCNKARSTIESHHVSMSERDISMHSAFKEELRGIMGKKEVKVPIVFVKGRLIGGADEIVKLEEEGKLGILFCDIPAAEVAVCEGCGGVRFVMCLDCNGSCKVLDEDGKKTVKCGECNENGLIQCPICC
ncbi:hypothetical protein M9H77_24056 [Catharanthus roseus]|uniref:Uncharacterized protein n=1 Tax=Catharanthus roseus TaxID=4058 RepID=A0ACC0AZ67_CATRO|nr:hypothetical protein M9H77_24056 [Catharanthus roseus]